MSIDPLGDDKALAAALALLWGEITYEEALEVYKEIENVE